MTRDGQAVFILQAQRADIRSVRRRRPPPAPESTAQTLRPAKPSTACFIESRWLAMVLTFFTMETVQITWGELWAQEIPPNRVHVSSYITRF